MMLDKHALTLANVKLIVYDFDGVMTNNRVTVDELGRESVVVNRADGLAVSIIKKMGIGQLILSTETNPVVKKRAEKLKLECLNGQDDKKQALADYLQQTNIRPSEVVYIGNDLNDFEVMEYVGYPVAPEDASLEIKKIAKMVTSAKGGEGVVREFLDILVTARTGKGAAS